MPAIPASESHALFMLIAAIILIFILLALYAGKYTGEYICGLHVPLSVQAYVHHPCLYVNIYIYIYIYILCPIPLGSILPRFVIFST